MDDNQIAAAVQACINEARKSDKPFRAINEALALLKRHGWPEADRLEVQIQVLRAMKQLRSANS